MSKRVTLKLQGIILLVLLIMQYLLGMITNLFVQFPQDESSGQLWEFAWRQVPLASHILVGILLLIGATVLVFRSLRQKSKLWVIASSIGFLAILFAGASGALFIPTQVALYSFAMAISFIVAVISYGWGIYSSKN